MRTLSCSSWLGVREVNEVLVAECIGKRFNGRQVLSSATLRAVSGQVRALVGRSGVGKSTLLKIAAGLLSADSGSVFVAGAICPAPRLIDLASAGLFYLPDRGLLSNAFTVRTQLELIRRRFDGADPEEAMRRMGIAGCVDARPATLSGGELGRAELAAILVRRPTCLLADEPYRGISPLDRDALSRAFREIAASDAAVVITGHEVATLFDAVNHVTWCTDGTTYELGSPESAMADERFRRGYLGTR